jgi:hypothetical protein
MHKTEGTVFQCLDVPGMRFAPASSKQVSNVRKRIRKGVTTFEDRNDVIADAMYTTLSYGYRCPHSSVELGISPCDECETAVFRTMRTPQFTQTWEALEQMHWAELAKTLTPVAGIQ